MSDLLNQYPVSFKENTPLSNDLADNADLLIICNELRFKCDELKNRTSEKQKIIKTLRRQLRTALAKNPTNILENLEDYKRDNKNLRSQLDSTRCEMELLRDTLLPDPSFQIIDIHGCDYLTAHDAAHILGMSVNGLSRKKRLVSFKYHNGFHSKTIYLADDIYHLAADRYARTHIGRPPCWKPEYKHNKRGPLNKHPFGRCLASNLPIEQNEV